MNHSKLTRIDNTVPSSSITDPDDQDIVDGNVEIKIQSDTDAMWATAYYYYDENENSEPDDGTDWVTIGNERYSTSDENNRGFTFDWDTTNLDDGEYLIKTKTYDRALNMDLDSISVTVDNS